ncbi:hypothetical protein RCH23_002107 [Cryobacterium sp. CAN_C3]|uniref:hypothetical protein n=1 Tax=unclassified Cryobacterium TaxID=2649013 RepID=UPI0018C9EFCC|nr:hypothetical protein [Cryobacterium sp. CAN_C3]MEC5154722.1 hypothetical protein [Cryobacterium sp. CAN_C3]
MTAHRAKELSVFKITTSAAAEVLMYIRNNTTGGSAASVAVGCPYEPVSGVSFELGETGRLNFLDGRGHTTAGLVTNVEQVYDLEFEPLP